MSADDKNQTLRDRISEVRAEIDDAEAEYYEIEFCGNDHEWVDACEYIDALYCQLDDLNDELDDIMDAEWRKQA
jgi:hypothetical protein